MGDLVGIAQNKIHVDCQHMGGGFGSKFNFGKWGSVGALLAKQSGRPVKLMLERDLELMIAGNRPSAYAKIKVAAKKMALSRPSTRKSGALAEIKDTIRHRFLMCSPKFQTQRSSVPACEQIAALRRPGARRIIRKVAF
jgi:xanthine dehydrogenase molybdopterin-binding subunit B